MSRTLELSASGALAMRPLVPELSLRLMGWFEEEGGRVYPSRDPSDPPMRFPRPPPSQMIIEEARRKLPAFEKGCAGVTPDGLLGWLTMVALAVRNPPSAEDLPKIARAFAAVLSDIPGGCFTAETAKRAGRTFEFWPSAADINKLVEPESEPMLRTLARIRDLAAREVVDVPSGPLRREPAEDKDAVLAYVKERRAELAQELKANRASEPKPEPYVSKPLHPEHLKFLRDNDPLVQRARDAQAEQSATDQGIFS